MKAMQIRPPAVSGLFYPSDPTLLSLNIDGMLEDVRDLRLAGTPLGVVSPHAGYAYSGPTAAMAFAALRSRTFRTAVIVSPSHREYFNGISVYEGDAYRTPLGLINVDVELRKYIVEDKGIIKSSVLGHRDEHAIEVQLPFLQRINPEAKILPVVMGDQRPEYCRLLGQALANALKDRDAVLIASSDLSHFYAHEDAVKIDAVAAADIRDGHVSRLLEDLATKRCEACGGGPIAAVMTASSMLGADRNTVLHQCTSGDVTGDHSRVVGYLSAAFIRTGAAA
ncbi:MAG: AmmeMemoRadiSam system protein B [Bacteroidetes bacterium]|nr:AmmeMemoRadiSam system protein B [Bacteroidota bacterium]